MSNPTPHPILAQQFESSEIAFIGIDKEIAAMQETIRELRTFRNTFTPSYRLPPEILSRIFSLIRLFSTLVPRSHGLSSLQWVAVTSVSKHWRNVAIRSPELWSHISSSYPKPLLQEWLQRSKASPLSV
ncbi:hypothetical protein BDN72DRAFT_773315, partial [Pluteus cervinus]